MPSVPRPLTTSEVQTVLTAERNGDAFLLLRDEKTGVLHVLEPQGRTTIGRDPENDVCVDWDRLVSGVHVELQPAGHDWVAQDDGLSRNGTFVNGARLNGRHRLRDGDLIRAGATMIVFRRPEATPTGGTEIAETPPPSVEQITPAQHRVLVALCRPYWSGTDSRFPAPNKVIGQEVSLGIDAVKRHLRDVAKKYCLDAIPAGERRVRLAEFAQQWGLVSERDYREK